MYSTRKSVRLARYSSDDALEKAIIRKSLLREGATPSGSCGSRARSTRRGTSSEGGDLDRRTPGLSKTKRLGRKCDILLSDEEARHFRGFVEAST